MQLAPNSDLYFGVDIQGLLEEWWRNGGAEEVLSNLDGENLSGYPLGFVTLQQGAPHDWRNPLAYVQHVLTHDPIGDADFYGPAGLFQNVAGKGRFALRERHDSLAAETKPWLLHPGDFPYGGFVLDASAGASGLPGGRKDHRAVLKIMEKLRDLRAEAAAPMVEAVDNRKKGAPGEEQVKYMLTGSDWRITDDGVLVQRRRTTAPVGPGHTHSAAYKD
jgi:hypothetical protein